MKRLNRKKLIEDFEHLRQGYRDILDFVKLDDVQTFTFESFHWFADKRVVDLGGESVYEDNSKNKKDRKLKTRKEMYHAQRIK